MAYDGSLTFDTQIDPSGFNKGTTSLSKQANGLKSIFSGIGKTIAKVFAVTQLVKFGKEAVDLASDIQEVQNVVDTAFGDMKYKMESFAESAIEMYGISKLTAKQTGSTFMAMANGLGLADKAASDMSLQLTALSADMASFYNKKQDVTSTALKSVFTGETETLKQFGIVMTEANLEAFRLAQGIETSYKKMSQAEKVALRYNYVMQQTKLAQGDFAKTQNSWANQTRILAERWKEFLSILGSGIIKILTPLVQVLNTILQYMISFANVISGLIGGETKQQEAMSESIGGSVEKQKELTEATKETAKANSKTLASFDEIQKLTDSNESGNTSNSGDLSFDVATPYNFEFETQSVDVTFDKIQGKLEELKDYISQFKAPFENWFKVDVSKLGKTIKTSFMTVFQGLGETVTLVFSDLFNTIIPQVITTLGTYILPFYTQLTSQIVQTLTTGFSVFNSLFQNIWSTGVMPAIDLFVKLWDDDWRTVYEAWDEWGGPIFENVRTLIENIGETWQSVWDNMLQPIWDNFMLIIDELWTNHLQPLLANILDLVGELINGALEIYNSVISPIVQWLVEILGPVVSNLVNFVLNLTAGLLGNLIEVINGIITTLKGLIQFIVGVFTLDWEKAWEGIRNIFGGIFESLGGIVKAVINVIIGVINALITAFESTVNAIIDAINSLEITNPFNGEEIWSPNIPRLKMGRIPYLATGTVVPANYGEFAAVLGDNKREPEIVSPLSTMKQALIEALAESGFNNSSDATIILELDGNELGRAVYRLNKKESKRIGVSTRVSGGVY